MEGLFLIPNSHDNNKLTNINIESTNKYLHTIRSLFSCNDILAWLLPYHPLVQVSSRKRTRNMKLKEIPRTATFAWSPASADPLIATGTAAGAIDADFSVATSLEIWPLNLLDRTVGSFEATPRMAADTDARFHDLAFNADGSVIVGALENGTVETWKVTPDSLQPGTKNTTQHAGNAVHSVNFSRLDAKKFATGGSGGNVFVWDLGRISEATTAAASSASANDDVLTVAWNNRASQILASGGTRGFVNIWDTNRKREVLHLHYTSPKTGSRVPISGVSWHPTNSTKLLTTSLDDQEPVVLIWDLKNANTPEKVLKGHSAGVLGAEWCSQDENLLLSYGKDNSTLLWNPQTGQQLGTYPISTEWTFKTQFHPHMPDLWAGASFDGKVTVQTLQDTTPIPDDSGKPQGETDFWESGTALEAVHPSFTESQAPSWLLRPVSATFGFGGKTVIARGTSVTIGHAGDATLSKEAQVLNDALKTGDLSVLADSARDPDWGVLLEFLQNKEAAVSNHTPKAPVIEERFDIQPPYEPSGPLELDDGEATQLAIGNDIEGAVNALLAENKAADALALASLGNPDLLARARQAYLRQEAPKKPYLRVAWDMSSGNVDDIVENCQVESWKDALRAALSVASTDGSKASDAVSKLGKRLVKAENRENAIITSLVGEDATAAAELWLSELPSLESKIAENEKTPAYAAHVKALRQVIEKITAATKIVGPINDSDAIFAAFRDFANITASEGNLDLAKHYLSALPAKYAEEQERIDKATQPTSSRLPSARPQVYGNRLPTGAPEASPYVPAAPSNPYAPASAPFVPGQLPAKPTQNIPPRSVRQPAASVPERGSTPGPIPPPPGPNPGTRRIRSNAPSGWNDITDLAHAPRRTPVAPQVITPAYATTAANGPPVSSASASASASGGSSVGAPPPPPKVGERVRSPTVNSGNGFVPTPAPIASPYAPPPGSVETPSISRPVAPSKPPANPYVHKSAPRTHSAPKANPYVPQSSDPIRSTPSPSRPVASSGFAPPPPGPAKVVPPPPGRAPPPRAAPTAPAPPPAATVVPPPPHAIAASTASSSLAATRQAAPEPAVAKSAVNPPPSQAPPANRRPKGDRSQIPPNVMPIYTSLTAELNRVRPVVEAQFKRQFDDTRRRLDILFDHLNNGDLLTPATVNDLLTVVEYIDQRQYPSAEGLLTEILASRSEQCEQWMTGVKRLVTMGKAVPV